MSVRRGGPGAADPHAALASSPRRRLLGLLRDSDTPQDAHELARATGLHLSTVRFHLDVLRQAGLVASRPQPRVSPGRPRTVYTAVTRGLTQAEAGYQELAALLASHFGDTPRARTTRAEQAGVAWATQLIPTPATPASGPGIDRAALAVTSLFAELGFDPELIHDGESREIRLRACPFRAVARAHTEVVCAAHLGLLRGTLSQLAAPPTAVRLQSFVTPELCVASLTPQI